jgi:hypothetical protein
MSDTIMMIKASYQDNKKMSKTEEVEEQEEDISNNLANICWLFNIYKAFLSICYL